MCQCPRRRHDRRNVRRRRRSRRRCSGSSGRRRRVRRGRRRCWLASRCGRRRCWLACGCWRRRLASTAAVRLRRRRPVRPYRRAGVSAQRLLDRLSMLLALRSVRIVRRSERHGSSSGCNMRGRRVAPLGPCRAVRRSNRVPVGRRDLPAGSPLAVRVPAPARSRSGGGRCSSRLRCLGRDGLRAGVGGRLVRRGASVADGAASAAGPTVAQGLPAWRRLGCRSQPHLARPEFGSPGRRVDGRRCRRDRRRRERPHRAGTGAEPRPSGAQPQPGSPRRSDVRASGSERSAQRCRRHRPVSDVSWTIATSSSTRGSGAWRISVNASPSVSIPRTSPAGPSRRARSVSASMRCDGSCTSSGAISDRKPLRRNRDQFLGDRARVATSADRMRHHLQRPTGIVLDHRLHELVERDHLATSPPAFDISSRHDSVSRGDPAPWATTCSIASSRHRESGVLGDPADVLLQRVGSEQMELQVLRAAADRVRHLLRVGRGEHEHHVRRRLLERLQQRSFGALREHVDLVEDVHLVATGRAERRLLDQVAHGVDAVVRRCVEFVDVVARALPRPTGTNRTRSTVRRPRDSGS